VRTRIAVDSAMPIHIAFFTILSPPFLVTHKAALAAGRTVNKKDKSRKLRASVLQSSASFKGQWCRVEEKTRAPA
jgi:hypothetical protein